MYSPVLRGFGGRRHEGAAREDKLYDNDNDNNDDDGDDDCSYDDDGDDNDDDKHQ